MSNEELFTVIGFGIGAPVIAILFALLLAKQAQFMQKAGEHFLEIVKQAGETGKEFDGRIHEIEVPDRSLSQNLTALLVSLLFFVALGLLRISWTDVAILVVVLLVHELGHLAGMRLFGYRDVRMFFIPLLGAAVAGSETEPGTVKRVIVLFLGPLPGLLLGFLCFVAYMKTGQEMYLRCGNMFLIVNVFNLLPFYPLDGARILENILFSRNARIESSFKLVATLGLFFIALKLHSVLLGIFALFVLVSLPVTKRLVSIAEQIRHEIPREEACRFDRIPDRYLARIKELLEERSHGEVRGKVLVRSCVEIWRRVCNRPASTRATVSLLLLYLFSLTVGIGTPAAIILLARSAQ